MTSRLNIKRALQDAVSKFRSQDEFGSNGAKGLAPEMGLSAGSLSHKVSPTYPGAHCSPEEVVEICKKTGDIGPMQAMCAELGGVYLPLVASLDKASCLIVGSVKEYGEWMAKANSGLQMEDRELTDAYMADLERELLESVTECMRLHSKLRARHAGINGRHLQQVRAA